MYSSLNSSPQMGWCTIYFFWFYFLLFNVGWTAQLVGSLFQDQGSNWVHSSESLSLNHWIAREFPDGLLDSSLLTPSFFRGTHVWENSHPVTQGQHLGGSWPSPAQQLWISQPCPGPGGRPGIWDSRYFTNQISSSFSHLGGCVWEGCGVKTNSVGTQGEEYCSL